MRAHVSICRLDFTIFIFGVRPLVIKFFQNFAKLSDGGVDKKFFTIAPMPAISYC